MLNWLYTAISWVLLKWHDLFSLVLNPDSGLTWALSIVFLVITIRVLLFRFFVKQVHTQRAMQDLQPKIQALRQKYKNDRQTMSREMMKLQQEAGVNPLGGCLPILLQAPVFLALFHVLRRLKPGAASLYGWTDTQTFSATHAKLFGAPIVSSFQSNESTLHSLGANPANVRVVALVMIVLMVVATYITQKQMMGRNSQQLEGTQATVQKLMLYVIPASLFVSGFFFPIGVLCYWLTNNVWTLGQQFFVFKRIAHQTAAASTRRTDVDPALLAPKVGVKPTRAKGRPAEAPNGSAQTDESAQTSEQAKPAEKSQAEQQKQPARRDTRPQPGKRPPGKAKKKRR